MNNIVAAISSFFANFVSGTFPSVPTHAILLGCTIIGDGLVAAGIIIESWPPKDRKEWIALIFVFWGVIMSAFFTIALFVFDEGISGTQKSRIDTQQRTIIALEKLLAPRVIRPSERREIIRKLKRLPSLPFAFAMMTGLEDTNLLFQIAITLKEAGWKWIPSPAPGISYPINGSPNVTVVPFAIGVEITVRQSDETTLENRVTILKNELIRSGVAAALTVVADKTLPAPKTVEIIVGAKP